MIEVADTSFGYDTVQKAKLYASFGVREYWVIQAWTLETRVHRRPTTDGYMDVKEVNSSDRIEPRLVPQLGLRLGE